jgi:hypothetical protein
VFVWLDSWIIATKEDQAMKQEVLVGVACVHAAIVGYQIIEQNNSGQSGAAMSTSVARLQQNVPDADAPNIGKVLAAAVDDQRDKQNRAGIGVNLVVQSVTVVDGDGTPVMFFGGRSGSSQFMTLDQRGEQVFSMVTRPSGYHSFDLLGAGQSVLTLMSSPDEDSLWLDMASPDGRAGVQAMFSGAGSAFTVRSPLAWDRQYDAEIEFFTGGGALSPLPGHINTVISKSSQQRLASSSASKKQLVSDKELADAMQAVDRMLSQPLD